MHAASALELYRCPGEEYDIPHAVHLARLAASFSKCRNCVHAPGASSPPREAVADGDSPTEAANEILRLFTPEGVRGRYLNDLTRAMAAKIAGAMASCLWEDSVCAGSATWDSYGVPSAAPEAHARLSVLTNTKSQSANEGVRLLAPGCPGPSVVLGYDERPSSPDLVTGVGQILRRMGCQVIDIGAATRPCLLFAVDHLAAAAAVHITGTGCDPGWTGLDFVMRGGLPCSSPGLLGRIATCCREGFSRPTRRPGSQRFFQAAIPYEASLWKHFHALRPLKIALACPGRPVRELFERVFRKVACRLLFIDTPVRKRSLLDSADPDLAHTAQAICLERADLGMLVDDDGERCAFFDETGQLVPPQVLARLLASDDEGKTVPIADGVPRIPIEPDPSPARSHMTRETMTRMMREQRMSFAADGAGRYWFADRYPACDALLTLVHLLHALSRSDRLFSQVCSDAE